jgi:hypothetical protein
MKPRDPKLDPVALDLLARSRIIEMRESAEEFAELIRERPIPSLSSSNPAEREMVLLIQLLRERDRCRRLLSLWLHGA